VSRSDILEYANRSRSWGELAKNLGMSMAAARYKANSQGLRQEVESIFLEARIQAQKEVYTRRQLRWTNRRRRPLLMQSLTPEELKQSTNENLSRLLDYGVNCS
jgi:hypothetical protein